VGAFDLWPVVNQAGAYGSTARLPSFRWAEVVVNATAPVVLSPSANYSLVFNTRSTTSASWAVAAPASAAGSAIIAAGPLLTASSGVYRQTPGLPGDFVGKARFFECGADYAPPASPSPAGSCQVGATSETAPTSLETTYNTNNANGPAAQGLTVGRAMTVASVGFDLVWLESMPNALVTLAQLGHSLRVHRTLELACMACAWNTHH
jgi:hypothetical protein